MNQYDKIVESISKYPDREALRYFGKSVSYRRLGEMIEAAASGMYNMGVVSGDIVCVALPTTPESIAIVYALNKIGAVASAIDVRFTGRQVASIVNSLHSKMLFIMGFNIKEVASVANEMCVDCVVVMRGCEIFPRMASSWYAFGELFNGRRKTFNRVDKFIHWDELIDASDGNAPHYEWNTDTAQMIFQTSGTTGRTKSVMVTSENIAMLATNLEKEEILFEPDDSDTVLCLIPLFAFTGFVATVHLPLCRGMSVAIVPIWKSKDFVKIIARVKPQVVFSIPSNWDTIYNTSNRTYNLSFLKTVIIAGDVLKPDFERDINDFIHYCGGRCEIVKLYGMTETVGFIAATKSRSSFKYQLGFSGKVVDGIKVKIVDDEVCVLSPTRLLGYYDNKEATNQLLRMHEDGHIWLHTGDIGHFDSEGNLYVVGRKKRIIIRFDGTKIFPIEIEDIILRHPNVYACAVVGGVDRKHPQNSLPVAFCVVKGLKSKKRIVRYANKELPTFLRPQRIIFIDRMPLLGNGKVNLKRLEEKANE